MRGRADERLAADVEAGVEHCATTLARAHAAQQLGQLTRILAGHDHQDTRSNTINKTAVHIIITIK
jgi:hypothetical protein